MRDLFTICVLLYGDFPDLARRCLASLLKLGPENLNLRIGTNDISQATSKIVSEFIGVAGTVRYYPSAENRHKYPVMRDMFYGPLGPITTPYVMWFDDDSYISSPDGWLQKVVVAMSNADMVGGIYNIPWQGNQREFVKAQPWYGGKDPAARNVIRFATGGWWTAKTEILSKFDYPWPVLNHRGGDAMLGELCFQQDYRLNTFRTGVCINADDKGRESKAPKRGFDEKPIGFDFDPAVDNLNRATNPPPAAQQAAQQTAPAVKRRRVMEL